MSEYKLPVPKAPDASGNPPPYDAHGDLARRCAEAEARSREDVDLMLRLSNELEAAQKREAAYREALERIRAKCGPEDGTFAMLADKALQSDAGSATFDEQPLRCEVAHGRLAIVIGVNTLAFADKERMDETMGIRVSDPVGFARDVAAELRKEREDGSTILTDLLDLAMERAKDNGSTAIEYR